MKEIASLCKPLAADISEIEKAGNYNLALPSGEVTLSSDDYEITSEDMPGAARHYRRQTHRCS